MIYDQVRPNTSGWNQVISEFERNVKIFLLLQESPDESVRTMAKENASLMQQAFHNMHCTVDGAVCKCDSVEVLTKKRPMNSPEQIREWNDGIALVEKQIRDKDELTNKQKLDLVQQLHDIQIGDKEGIEILNTNAKKLVSENLKTLEDERMKTVETNKKILLQRISESDLEKKTKDDLTKQTNSVKTSEKNSQDDLTSINDTLQDKIKELSENQPIESETSNPDNPNKEA